MLYIVINRLYNSFIFTALSQYKFIKMKIVSAIHANLINMRKNVNWLKLLQKLIFRQLIKQASEEG